MGRKVRALLGAYLCHQLEGCAGLGRGPADRAWGRAGEMEEEMENPEMVDLPEKLKHQLRHRELFLSRQLESLPATHIR